MKLSELKKAPAVRPSRQLALSEIEFLWIDDFWDGALSGMLKFQAEHFWFEMIEESEEATSTWYRRFAVVQLSSAQLARQHEIHRDFQRHVGKHYDCVGAENELPRPQEEWHKFYDKYGIHYQPNFDENSVVAWFERE